MNATVLNYHLATTRAADIEREARLHARQAEAAEPRRRGFARLRRDRAVSGIPRFAA
jgi:hypothetical protein